MRPFTRFRGGPGTFVEAAVDLWPIWGTTRGPLHPALVQITIRDDEDVRCQYDLWVGDLGHLLRRWPTTSTVTIPDIPSVLFEQSSGVEGGRIWFEHRTVDDVEQTLAVLEYDHTTVFSWVEEPEDDLLGAFVRSLAEAFEYLVRAWAHSSRRSDHDVAESRTMAPSGELFRNRPLNSWHVRIGGSSLRAVEVDEVRGANDEVRARCIMIMYPDVFRGVGMAVWNEETFRMWTPERSWLLDDGLTQDEMTPAETSLSMMLKTAGCPAPPPGTPSSMPR